jgi:hypothetical protein
MPDEQPIAKRPPGQTDREAEIGLCPLRAGNSDAAREGKDGGGLEEGAAGEGFAGRCVVFRGYPIPRVKTRG